MVKAGDKTLESYGYAPNNGPLITVAYGNGDTQEILYDKEERIRARRWNGESTDAVRYEYDDYGTLEKETDLVNGRIDKDQYDMTGRLVQSTTLEKNTGAAGEPTVANTHTVQSLEIGYDSYNRVNRLVQSLEGSKTKTGLVYGDASKTQRPGLSYGLTVDGKQRQSLAYDAMARCTKETVTLPGGQKRENCFTYGTLRHLTDTDSLLSAMSNGTESWSYEYDNVGNITKITSGTKVITYQYDELNQLIRENNGVLGITVLYAYDAGGNMTSRKTYAYTEGAVSTVQTQDLFTYRTDGWKDQLLSWNGKSYAYDAGGNPTVLRGMALTWGEGHRLKRIAAIEGGATYIAGNRANKVTDMVQFGSKAAEALGNAAVNYSIGQPMELAATGVSAAAKPVTKAIAKNMGIATSNARTTKRSNTRVITTVSGRKKVIHKVKKPTRRNTKFQRVCMA